MSGFAGIIRLDPTLETAEADRAAIARMAEAIAFRGPDAQQQSSHDGASFAFSLLTTGPAPQAPAQPVTLDGETFLLGEVRIDGRDELILKLQQHGASISSSTADEELVLRFVELFGVEALPELDGDFSFVLWKPRERRFFGFRDLSGARPFFYSQSNGRLVFSNTLQAVLAASGVRDLNNEFLADFLLGDPYYNPEKTAYHGTYRLPAGHLFKFSASGPLVQRIAFAPMEDLLVLRRQQDYVEEFLSLFSKAVKDRLPERAATIFLSGGLDSTAIAACAASASRAGSKGARRISALAVDSRPVVDDPEADLASFVADFLEIPCQVVHSGNELPFAHWQGTKDCLLEPALDPYANLYISYYSIVSDRCRVVFSGTGGDELLRLQALPYLRHVNKERGALSMVSIVLRYLIRERHLPPLGTGFRAGIRRLLRKQPTEITYPPWFCVEFEDSLGLRGRWRQMSASSSSEHPYNPRAYAAMNDLSLAAVLEVADASWTRRAVEQRTPFHDRRLIRFLLRIPSVPWAADKYLLRKSQIGRLPEKIRLRPKTPVLQDLLVVHALSGRWDPRFPDRPPAVLQSMVRWPMLNALLDHVRGGSLYVHLRPVALAYWLKAVEMGQSVK